MAIQFPLHRAIFRNRLSLHHQLNHLPICAKPSVAHYPSNTQAKQSLKSFDATLALKQSELSKLQTLTVLKVKLQYIRVACHLANWFCWVGKMRLFAYCCYGVKTNLTCLNQPVANDKVADGLLVRDIDGNGLIDTGRELFGSETLLANGKKAANGFVALAELDLTINGGNHDGKIDSSDAAFSTLQVWQDANSDGYSSEAELKTLTEAGIQSINLNYTSTAFSIYNPVFGNADVGWQTDASNNQHRQLGSYTSTDGATHAATDVWMQVDKMDAIATTTVEVSNEIDAMPDLEGYGNLHSLHQAMARNDVRRLIA